MRLDTDPRVVYITQGNFERGIPREKEMETSGFGVGCFLIGAAGES